MQILVTYSILFCIFYNLKNLTEILPVFSSSKDLKTKRELIDESRRGQLSPIMEKLWAVPNFKKIPNQTIKC